MLYAFNYIQKRLQKAAQPWLLCTNKSNGFKLSRQTKTKDAHSEEECQIVEVEKVFKNLWLFLLE